MQNNSGFVFEQHPVPQQISSYQFRLIGDMTLKQFFELAGGALVSVLFYASPLPGLFKWPLVVGSVIFGAALAFLPFQERPLEKWVGAFVRSIYSPTQFVWKRIDPAIFYPPSTPVATGGTVGQAPLAKKTTSVPFLKNLEDTEEKILNQVEGLLGKVQSQTFQATMPPRQILNQVPVNVPRPVVANVGPSQIASQNVAGGRVVQEIPQNQNTPTPLARGGASVMIPKATSFSVAAGQAGGQGYQAPIQTQVTPVSAVISQVLTPQKTGGEAAPANFSMGAAPPIVPDMPNIVVGQVLDAAGKIVDGAILEIRDGQGRPVRALKSARTGHFRIVTPLENGNYKILIEKEGLDFEPVEFMATGKIIEPIMISAKAEMQIPKSK